MNKEMPHELASFLELILRDKLPKIKPEITPREAALKSEFKEDVLTISYNGDVMGWINNIGLKTPDGAKYRALSIHGEVKHFHRIDAAKEFICSKYH